MPSIGSTFVNPLLTDIYLGYGGQQNYIAGQLFPRVEVDKETGIYFVRDKENLRAPASAYRSEFGRANRVSNTLTQATYRLEEKSLESAISWRVEWNQQVPFDARKNATMLVSEKLKLDKEIDLQATILAAASGANTVDASASWSTVGTDIVGMVRTGRDAIQKATGTRANVAVISKLTLNGILKNTAFLDSIKFVSIVNETTLQSALAMWLDVDKVLIADSVNNTAKEGQSDVMDWVWGKNFILAHVAPTPAVEVPSAGYELAMAGIAKVEEWDEVEVKTSLVRATDYYDNKIVDPTCLYIITNTVT